MRRPSFARSLMTAIFLASCSVQSEQEDPQASPTAVDSGLIAQDEPEEEDSPLEINAGVGIGPVQLGGNYGDLLAEIGPPRVSFEYFRCILAVWPDLGIEVVLSVGEDAVLSDDSPIVSVGTKRMDGFVGTIVPGMTRAEAESIIGECEDTVDEVHCYHPVGLYLGFNDDGLVKTVAVHPPYTVRPSPPEMALAEGGLR